MIAGISPVKHAEESAVLQVPKQSFTAPHRAEVFFNPRMRFSRTMDSLATGVLKPERILDGLSATGAKGVRIAKENSFVKKVFLLDANPKTVAFARTNVSLNKLGGRIEAICEDFNDFCESNENSFDFIAVDPFGTPAPFVDSALMALKKPGFLSLTSTDLANVVKKNAPTMRDYGAKPLYNDFSHETALRIILGFAERKAFGRNLSLEPLVCLYDAHFVKIIARVKHGRSEILLKKASGFVSYCDKCLSRFVGKRVKCSCGNRLLYAGPLWTGDFCEKGFLKKLFALNAKRNYADKNKMGKMLLLLQGEQNFPPWFFDVHVVAGKFGLAVGKKMDAILAGLRDAGFKTVKTHFDPLGIKTDATPGKIVQFI
ncbi:MAG: methyltransferase domain-containing protein [Candidatus Micrarchaeota archaeon]